jgi:hypothetical protein
MRYFAGPGFNTKALAAIGFFNEQSHVDRLWWTRFDELVESQETYGRIAAPRKSTLHNWFKTQRKRKVKRVEDNKEPGPKENALAAVGFFDVDEYVL